jgi:hypothetical protein
MGPFRSLRRLGILLWILPLLAALLCHGPAYAEARIVGDGNVSVTGITKDNIGNLYVIGTTNSVVLTGTNGAQTTSGGKNDIYVAKFDPQLGALQRTFFGGTKDELGAGIRMGKDGKVIITGSTNSPNLPGATNAFGGGQDAFLAKLDADLMHIVESIYISGADEYGYEQPNAMALDGNGNIYIAGYTTSSMFLNNDCASGSGDNWNSFWVAKYDPNLTLLNSACVKNAGTNGRVLGMALDSTLNVFVVGRTDSKTLPMTAGGVQPTHGGSTYDAFIFKLDKDFSHLQSTYYGGTGWDMAQAVDTDAEGNVYIAGWTQSQALTGTLGGAQPGFAGGQDAFVAVFNNSLTTLVQATFLGGWDYDGAYAMKVDRQTGDVFVSGFACSNDFPGTAGGVQPTLTPGTSQNSCWSGGTYDAFISILSGNLQTLKQSTYWGGTGNEWPQTMVISSTVTIAGSTNTGSTVTDPTKCWSPPCDLGFVCPMPLNLLSPPAPDIEVTPTNYDFGLVTIATPETRTIIVTNTGAAPLHLGELGFLNGSAFTATSPLWFPCSPFKTLEPNSSCAVEIVFNPQEVGLYEANYFIDSDDPDEHRVTVSLRGTGVLSGPRIRVTPQIIDFGGVFYDKQARTGDAIYQAILVENIGNENLYVPGAGFVNEVDSARYGFSFDQTVSPNTFGRCPPLIELAPTGRCYEMIKFSPKALGSVSGTAYVESDDPTVTDPQKRVYVTLKGQGVENWEMILERKLTVKDPQGNPVESRTLNKGSLPGTPSGVNPGAGATVKVASGKSPNSVGSSPTGGTGGTKSSMADTPYTPGIVVETPYMPPNPLFYVVVGETWKQLYPTNECTGISGVVLTGTTLSYTVTDNGDCDANMETDSIYHIIAQGTVSNTIVLYQGWNFVSLPLQPTETAIASVLGSISSSVEIVWAYDNENKRWLRWVPGQPPEYNSLSSMAAGKGYWTYMTADAALTVSGSVLTIPLTLSQGWNLVGYTGTNGVTDADTLLSPINGKWDMFWMWDGGWALKGSPVFSVPPYSPDFQSVARGAAYWIRMRQASEWTH